MAKKKHKKMTPDERARQLENQRRFERLLERRLAQDGITKEEALRLLRPAD